MKKKLFDELLESVKEGGRILNGEWSEETPNETGFYWFYGDPFASNLDKECENGFYSVEVWKISNGCAYVCHGHFMENEKGLWHRAILPTLPKEPYTPDKKFTLDK